ncbi:hypothetical protein ACSBLW_01045 [Thioclava sp. FR2]|uniref:hypothetical protein n=1 Tax=Thioclava sp. FR2 TaxID=3445780 RepID=UPI003EB957D6
MLIKLNIYSICAISALTVASAASAQQSRTAIDRDLQGVTDFRNPVFAGCLGQQTCTVSGITVAAFREDATGATVDATIYWDPVDGFGVQDGAQNDEIDFDETLIVTFANAQRVSGAWLSDLFVSESGRYNATATAGVDGEIGQMDMRRGGVSKTQLIVNADADLPTRTFNAELDPAVFSKNGDLLHRVIIRNNDVRLVSATGVQRVGPLNGGDGIIDADKQDLFAGLPTIEIDTQRLLSMIDGVVLFPVGEHNEDHVAGLASSPLALENLYQNSKAMRNGSDLSNGEVAAYLNSPISVDEIIFTAPFGSSNEFSVSGVIVLP